MEDKSIQDLTPRQKWVLKYLKHDCAGNFTSPSQVGNAYGRFVLNRLGLHSSTGSPILKELVKLGLVERNKKGWYKILPNSLHLLSNVN